MNIDEGYTKALIYCRVSDSKQKTNGNGLDSQEHRCRQYAEAKGYEVDAVFPDDATGGGDFMQRPGMVALLAFLDAKSHENYVVIFDDLKRYARDTEFHLKLRRTMAERGARRECLNFNFEDSPEGRFFETIAAAQGQLEREQNGRQVTQKMRARVERGYYCFGVVLGYRYEEMEGGGKILVPHEVNAPIMKEALEGFARGHFQTASEVARFLNGFPSTQRKARHGITRDRAKQMLRNPIYAGYMNIRKWNIHMHKGKHEPLISVATWKRIQDRLDGNAHAPARKDLSKDFPLRGFVACARCNNPMTAAWSKGRNARYPYYSCQGRDCELRGKSIRRDKIEGDFAALLKTLKPGVQMIELFRAMFEACWKRQTDMLKVAAKSAAKDAAGIERKIDLLVERITEADNPAVVDAYERQIKSLTEKRAVLSEAATKKQPTKRHFDEIYRTALLFLSNPSNLWDTGKYELQRLVLRLVFTDRLAYCKNEGYRTASIAEPLRHTALFATSTSGMVAAAGLEPALPYGKQILSLSIINKINSLYKIFVQLCGITLQMLDHLTPQKFDIDDNNACQCFLNL